MASRADRRRYDAPVTHWREAKLAMTALCAALVISSWTLVAADRPWVEVTSPHFTVISDAGDKHAVRAAWQFEQVRAVLQRLWPWANLATREDQARLFDASAWALVHYLALGENGANH